MTEETIEVNPPIDTAAPAESSPAATEVAAPESFEQLLAQATEAERLQWQLNGTVPTPKGGKPDTSVAAPAAAETAPEPEPGTSTMKQETAEERSKRDKEHNERRFRRLVRESAQHKALADRLAEENAALRQGKPESAPGPQSQEPVMPDIETFEGTVPEFKAAMSDYRKALVQYEQTRLNQSIAAQKTQAAQKAAREQYQADLVKFKAQHEDFDEHLEAVTELDETAPHLSDAIIASGSAPALIYYLGQHSEEMEKLAGMSERAGILALGKILAGLNTEAPPAPKVKTTTSAPHPGKTIGGTSTAVKDPIKAAEDAGDWVTYNRLMNEMELGRRLTR